MSKNYMADVAKMLGVELGEEFRIEGFSCNPYRFTEDGLTDNSGFSPNSSLGVLLLGKAKIIKKLWTPKDGDEYYYIDVFGRVIKTSYVRNDNSDCMKLRTGNFFRTQEEAEENIEKWLEYIKQEPDFSWRINI